MPQDDQLTLTHDAALAAADAIRFARRFSRESRNVTPTPGVSAPMFAGGQSPTWPVMVTGAALTSPPEDAGLHPGVLFYPDETTLPPWQEIDCWVRPLPGDLLHVGAAGMGRLVGWRDPDGTYPDMPVYTIVCCSSGPPPGSPGSLVAEPGAGGVVQLTWDAPTGLPVPTQYVVEYSTDGTTFTQFVVTPDTEATVTGLADGVLHYFVVYALSSGGAAGPYSNVVQATPDATAPTVVQATVDPDGTTLILQFTEDVWPVASWGTFVVLNGDQSVTATYVTGDGTDTITFTLSTVINSGSIETLSIAANTARDAVGNLLAAVTGFVVTNNSTQAPPSCCDAELAAHPDLEATVPDGTYAGVHTLQWSAGIAPGGGDGWQKADIDWTFIVYCTGSVWKANVVYAIAQPDENVDATVQACGPFGATFTGILLASGATTVAVA